MEKDVRLGLVERLVYYFVWIGAVFYSIYKVYLTKKYLVNYNDLHNDFGPGWSWIGGKQDTADYEWETWMPLIFKLIPWYTIHCFGSAIIKYKTRHDTSERWLLHLWFITVALNFLYLYFGILGILCILIQPCISCLLLAINSKTIAWLTNLIILTAINFAKHSETIYQFFVHLENEEYFMLTIVICWTQLRSISFVMDNCGSKLYFKSFFVLLLHNTAYNLYLPNLFLGPVILYDEFFEGTMNCYIPWTRKRLFRSLFNIARYFFWMYFTEFALHFVYINAMQYHPQVLAKMDPWAFYGFGYCMGQYFHNKYVVVYGISGELARMDDIDSPPTPKCIGRIHLYSDMWKYFDVGLYTFLIKYIYVPTTTSNVKFRNFFGSFLCFSFVFMWHGIQKFIFVWSILNFLGVTIESIAKHVGKSKSYSNFVNKYFTTNSARRFHCAISVPLLAMSAISNFYFFAGLEVGNLFIIRLFKESSASIIVLLFCLYCCCQVSTDMNSYKKLNKNHHFLNKNQKFLK